MEKEKINYPEEIDTNSAETMFEQKYISNQSKIWLFFIISGVLFILLSIIKYNSSFISGNTQVLAFVGLTLLLWGGLFYLVKPVTYVESNLLIDIADSSYKTIDRITKELNYNSNSFYVPPYPKEIYIPQHLNGLKQIIALITVKNNFEMPSIDTMAESKFKIENPEGIIIVPPGSGFVTRFENQLGISLTNINLQQLIEILPKVILESFKLAKDIYIEVKEDVVYIKVAHSVFSELYEVEEVSSVYYIGCPLLSFMACAIAITTGRTISISEIKTSPDNLIIEAIYQILEV